MKRIFDRVYEGELLEYGKEGEISSYDRYVTFCLSRVILVQDHKDSNCELNRGCIERYIG